MRKLYNYKQFNLNEKNVFSWIKDNVINSLTGWAKDFLKAIKLGLIRKIPSGPRKGSPYAMLFVPENGSIVQQLRDYMSNKAAANEAAVPMQHDKIPNQNAGELKQEIKYYYNIKKQMADGAEKNDDSGKGLKIKPMFIYGAPGIGKTEIVAAVCDELTIPLLFLDVQFMNPEDFKGVPSVHEIRPAKVKDGILLDPGEGFTRSNPPSVFPRDNGKMNRGGVIFMDELNRSNESVLNSLMQFIQQGRIGDEYRLPNRWIIIAAGNRQEDDPDANISPIGTALTGRFSISNYAPGYGAAEGEEINDWANWASKEMHILPELVSFLKFNKELFHYNDPSTNAGSAYPTPRSWTEASKILMSRAKIQGKNDWRQLSKEFIMNVFSKEVGNDAALKFVGYLELLRHLTENDMKQMITDPMYAPIPNGIKNNPSYLFGLSDIVFNKIKKYNVKELYNIMIYFNRYNQNEMLSWLYKTILNKFPDMVHVKDNKTDTKEEAAMKAELPVIVTTNARKNNRL